MKKHPKKPPVALPVAPAPLPVPLELRPIASMSFGFNMCVVDSGLPAMVSKTWEPSAAQIDEQAWVRAYLQDAGCLVAGDIERLGCTGVARHEIEKSMQDEETRCMAAVAAGTRLRLGLAGSGVGLPCFVPPSRFCLIHNTIGGLEDGQAQYHAHFVDLISRLLTPEEEAKTKVMQHARKLKSVGEVNDFIAGKSPLAEDEPVVVEESEQEELPATVHAAPVWKCPDHDETVWACRYCLAQAIVEGPLEPKVAVYRLTEGRLYDVTADDSVENELRQSTENAVSVYVQAARFTRKLSRD